MRLVLNEVFGEGRYINEIIWKRRGGALNNFKSLGAVTDTMFLYSKSENYIFNTHRTKDSEDAQNYIKERFVYDDGDGRLYSRDPITNPSATATPSLIYEYKGYQPPTKGWAFSRKTMEEWDKLGKLYFPPDKSQRIRRKTFLDEYEGQPIQNLWSPDEAATPRGSINSPQADSMDTTGSPQASPSAMNDSAQSSSQGSGPNGSPQAADTQAPPSVF